MNEALDPLDPLTDQDRYWYKFTTDMEALRHKINLIQRAWPHVSYQYAGGYNYHVLAIKDPSWPYRTPMKRYRSSTFKIDVKEFIQYSDEEVMNAVELWLHIIDQWKERR